MPQRNRSMVKMVRDNNSRAERGAKRSSAGREASGRQRASGRQTSGQRRTAEGSERSSGRKTSGKTASKSVPKGSGPKTSGGKRTEPVGKSSGRRVSGERRGTSGRNVSAEGKAVAAKRAVNRGVGEPEERMDRRDSERARRRAERERKVRRQKITMVVSSCIILLSVLGIVVFCMPSVKVMFRLFQGDRYVEKEAYEDARGAYEKALEADPSSVKAYYNLANLYDRQEMDAEAEQVLQTGWEKTQHESLLRYYCVVVLNQAVAQINAQNCTLATADKCIRVLEQGAEEQKALELLDICRKRLFKVTEENGTCMLFFDEDTEQDTCSYTEYEQLLRRLLKVCQANPSEEVKEALRQFAVIDMPYVWISLPHLDSYAALLAEINGVVSDNGIGETIACLERAKEVRDYFSAAFEAFDAGNYAYARELIVEESYEKIRDDFIAENSGYWKGSVYIPVSREQLVLCREGETVRFSFPDQEDYNNKQGIIKVWGMKQEDDGVQRSGISYEPPVQSGSDSRTEYTVQYLYSNVKIKGKYVPQMNYRFDTNVTTPEGVTTNAIGDWGGEHEWEIDY